MLRYGFIDAYDPAKCAGRVRFEEDGFVSDWLRVIVKSTKGTEDAHDLETGEYVAVMLDERGEEGVILGAVYSETEKPAVSGKKIRVTKYADGTEVKYDGNSGTLTVNAAGAVEVTAAQTVSISAAVKVSLQAAQVEIIGATTITGAVTIAGALSLGGAMTMTGGAGAGIQTQGEISAASMDVSGAVTAGSVTASGTVEGSTVKSGLITLALHKHVSAAPGSPTGPATP